ncbi:UDP-N-acetylmuramoyl-tripeptide--D-alanyl-D-alanine ligase [Streptococcus sp. DD12]|uniref:UDP-N-acetylmuramoyl-tripeptide--D-alanyl-D- alanine ligase n=1 Tax=Streptococcus sp. DD12 TaxID=1777880 RepID=UPI0007932D9F|nr:UDP-N-acetylmuramoyl-tripeptide--D-alanyl-D-alanine ligase [Streptococcus sp. DD12]KXT76218.1 UDP-N-acetylmuramoylalanyl-D-glutamyl-2,6- diaminopimelate--D-alanyl-D-alanine ligase [Streptococcus sp. DD12]
MRLTIEEIAQVVGASPSEIAWPQGQVGNIEFDSRKIKAGDIFLPLQGQRDGHEFIETAFANGASVTFTEKPIVGRPYLLVAECLKAFQELASYYLEKQGVDVIAVTGSNGKTTTKDMIAAVLAKAYKTYKTQGNYNNEIGLPYTALHMPDDTEKIVLEMGQDHMGDIKLLSEIAKPHIGVVTLIGEAHLEFFGSREKIAQGKLQITEGMDGDGILIAPADPVLAPFLPKEQKVIHFGPDADIFVTDYVEHKNALDFKTNFLEEAIHLPVTGRYNAWNAMLAAYIGQLLSIDEADIRDALAHLELTQNRTEWKQAANGAEILSDVYNANPTATRLVLETFSKLPIADGGKKLVVLGDMKELGPDSVALHTQLLTSLSPEDFHSLIFYGEDYAELAQYAGQMFPLGRVYYFKKTENEDQFEDMVARVEEILEAKDQILIKGSHSMHLENLVARLEKASTEKE